LNRESGGRPNEILRFWFHGLAEEGAPYLPGTGGGDRPAEFDCEWQQTAML
jgi:hypothetical protein